jgi:uncharacterized OsmC-like protein
VGSEWSTNSASPTTSGSASAALGATTINSTVQLKRLQDAGSAGGLAPTASAQMFRYGATGRDGSLRCVEDSMAGRFAVKLGAGSFRSTADGAVCFPHEWTAEGVSVSAAFTGAHLLHVAAAGCVLNDLYREAAARGIRLDGVRVDADGDFDTEQWISTGVEYAIRLDSPADDAALVELVAVVDAVAEIPRAMRAGIRVRRTEAD